ncbi:MAG: iron export ABC transporter permease subunit FetB [Acidimicrobiales bacterium]|nr:MAG: iron export ABC transporter permease subunit FetB [Acidimicrobiales bacterium]
MNGRFEWVGMVGAVILVGAAAGLSRLQRLGLESEIVRSAVRGAVQLLVVGLGLGIVLDPRAPMLWSWMWVVGIVVLASWTVSRRVHGLPGVFRIALVAHAFTAAVCLAGMFGGGMFPLEGRALVPLAGMAVGNSMKAAVVGARTLLQGVRDHNDEIEARLALGLSGREATAHLVRSVLRTALTPQIETTRSVGLIALPGAMTGLILGGVDPVDAVLVQLAVLYMILGAVAIVTSVTVIGGLRSLVTPDHRLVWTGGRGELET